MDSGMSADVDTVMGLRQMFTTFADCDKPTVVATAATFAAADLLLGRQVAETDTEIRDIILTFISNLVASRDVLRENATMMALMPKGVM